GIADCRGRSQYGLLQCGQTFRVDACSSQGHKPGIAACSRAPAEAFNSWQQIGNDAILCLFGLVEGFHDSRDRSRPTSRTELLGCISIAGARCLLPIGSRISRPRFYTMRRPDAQAREHDWGDLMNFEQNLFISYAHIDDQPLTPGEKGWITRFHATLKKMLDMRLGRETKIWRDEKLQGNDVFSNEIVAQFNQSAVLASIVTPRYLHSEWCTREAREFCQSAERNGGLVVGNKSRVFKVIKTPVDAEELEALPPHMKDLLGFEFFTYEDGVSLELDPDYGPEYNQRYLKKIALLAQDIAQLLKTLQAEGGASKSNDSNVPSEPPAPSKPAVYLAECSYDRKQARELLEGELKRLGYPVLPDKRLPQDE